MKHRCRYFLKMVHICFMNLKHQTPIEKRNVVGSLSQVAIISVAVYIFFSLSHPIDWWRRLNHNFFYSVLLFVTFVWSVGMSYYSSSNSLSISWFGWVCLLKLLRVFAAVNVGVWRFNEKGPCNLMYKTMTLLHLWNIIQFPTKLFSISLFFYFSFLFYHIQCNQWLSTMCSYNFETIWYVQLSSYFLNRSTHFN